MAIIDVKHDLMAKRTLPGHLEAALYDMYEKRGAGLPL